MRFRERQLSRREIAFRANQHQNIFRPISMLIGVISENLFQVNGVGLQRADQTKIETAGVGKEILQLSRRVHLRQPILSALLGRLDRDLLPFCLFLF